MENGEEAGQRNEIKVKWTYVANCISKENEKRLNTKPSK